MCKIMSYKDNHVLCVKKQENSKLKIFLGGQIFQKKILKKHVVGQKIQNPARGQKALLEGVGSIWTLGGGGHKKSKQVGVYTPWHPPCSPMSSSISFWIIIV